MSCSYNAEFANVYVSINNLEGNFNAITANTLNNYNQVTQIVSQQASVYNTIYYESGNISTLNANVTYDLNVNSRYDMSNRNLVIVPIGATYRFNASVAPDRWSELR